MRTGDAVEGNAPVCPYRGPAVFQTEDAGWFFGRSRLVAGLASRLQDGATLVVAGPARCGKSSLVRAGLLPAIAAGEPPRSGGRPHSVFVPGSHPLDALWAALGTISSEPLPDIFSLEEAPGPAAARFVREGVLCVDQLETLFTAASDPAERGAFLGVLEALHAGQSPRFRLILVIGTDFYGACSGIDWLASAISENHVLVGRPTREEMREVIEAPARKAGLRLEEGLADRMLDDIGGDPAPLAALSRALRETWSGRRGRILTLESYEQSRKPAPTPPAAAHPTPIAEANPRAGRPSDPPPKAPAGTGARKAERPASRTTPIMLALFVLAVLASLALGILLTQVGH